VPWGDDPPRVDDAGVTTEPITDEIEREECLSLLATNHLGQLALTRAALPTVVPVHFVVCEDHVLIHFASMLHDVAWKDGEIVALHVSQFDEQEQCGWSVCVTGRAHGMPDLGGNDASPHAPWVIIGGGKLVALDLEIVRGERLGTHVHVEPLPAAS
jgi:Pyridoxamine 5'-phosphate oxidase